MMPVRARVSLFRCGCAAIARSAFGEPFVLKMFRSSMTRNGSGDPDATGSAPTTHTRRLLVISNPQTSQRLGRDKRAATLWQDTFLLGGPPKLSTPSGGGFAFL